MGCTCTDPCTSLPNCTCPVKDLKTDCSLYNGAELPCSGITTNTILTNVIIALDAAICNKFNEAINYLTLINIGGAAEIYKGISGIGNKEIRTLQSGDANLMDVVQDTDTINFTPGTPSLDLTADILSLIVTTALGATVFDTVDLSAYNGAGVNTFVQSASFDGGTFDLTIVRNNGEPNIVVPLDALNKYVASAAYTPASDIVTLTLTDASTVSINLAVLVAEILADAASAQVRADYLEENPASFAFIENRDAVTSIAIPPAGTYVLQEANKNYVIEIDNAAGNVTIDVSAILVPSTNTRFFSGFIQKGTGTVTFIGYDIKPAGLTDVIFGQGHVAAFEVINGTRYLFGTLKPV